MTFSPAMVTRALHQTQANMGAAITVMAQKMELLCRDMGREAEKARRTAQQERINRIQDLVSSMKWNATVTATFGVCTGLFGIVAAASTAVSNKDMAGYMRSLPFGDRITQLQFDAAANSWNAPTGGLLTDPKKLSEAAKGALDVFSGLSSTSSQVAKTLSDSKQSSYQSLADELRVRSDDLDSHKRDAQESANTARRIQEDAMRGEKDTAASILR